MNEATIISYIVSRWIIWLIICILLSVFFVIFSFISRIKKYRWWILVLGLLLTIYISIPTITGIMDIKEEAYVIEHVNYYRSNATTTRNRLIASQNIQITTPDGKTLVLRGATQDFPYGELSGTIIYAKRSKIAISFVPD